MKADHAVQAGPDHIRNLNWRGSLFCDTLKRLCYLDKKLVGTIRGGIGLHIRVNLSHRIGLAHKHQSIELRLFPPKSYIGASYGLQRLAAASTFNGGFHLCQKLLETDSSQFPCKLVSIFEVEIDRRC